MNEFFHHDINLDMSVRRFVTKRLIGIDKKATIQEGVQRMVEFNISSMAVLDGDDVVGFFTDTDIKKRVVARGLSPELAVTEIMTRDLVTADINTSIRDVLELLSKNKIKHLLITKQEKFIGIITLRDLENSERQRLETHIGRE